MGADREGGQHQGGVIVYRPGTTPAGHDDRRLHDAVKGAIYQIALRKVG